MVGSNIINASSATIAHKAHSGGSRVSLPPTGLLIGRS